MTQGHMTDEDLGALLAAEIRKEQERYAADPLLYQGAYVMRGALNAIKLAYRAGRGWVPGHFEGNEPL